MYYIYWKYFYGQLSVYGLQIAYRPRRYLVVADVFSMIYDQIIKKKKFSQVVCSTLFKRKTKNFTSGLAKWGLQSLELLQRVIQRRARQCIPILYSQFNYPHSRQDFD